MSQENVETVERAIDAFNGRDIETLADLLTADFEWFGALLGKGERGSYRGREGMEAYFEEATAIWEEFRMLTDEFRDLGDRVLVFGRMEGRTGGSGIAVEAPLGVVFELREARMSRCRSYLDPSEALRAAGLTK
jgi:ketosteroid isomerase-like protein